MSFRSWNTDWAITWGMRCSVMFICVKTCSTEEGVRVTAQTWGRRLNSDLSRHIKDCQHVICYLNFLTRKKKRKKIHIHIYIYIYIYTVYVRWHTYRTERPVPKRFSTNMCSVTPLIFYRAISFSSFKTVNRTTKTIQRETEEYSKPIFLVDRGNKSYLCVKLVWTFSRRDYLHTLNVKSHTLPLKIWGQ